MAQLICDYNLLREPNLWAPGKEPVGLVHFRKCHALGKQIYGLIYPQKLTTDSSDDIGSHIGKGYINGNATNCNIAHNAHGKYLHAKKYYGSDGYLIASNGFPLNSGTVVLKYILAVTASDYENLFRDSNNVSTLYRVSSTNFYWKYRGTNAANIVYTGSTIFTANVPNTIVVSWGNGNLVVAANGRLLYNSTFTTSGSSTEGNNFIPFTINTIALETYLYLVATYQGKISAGYALDISKDVYQLLEAA